MTLVGQGNILGLDAIDIPSQNPTALYVASPIAPTLKPVPTILYNLGAGDEPQYVPIKVVDPASSIPCPSVPGTPLQPLVPPTPPTLPRPLLVPTKNPSVFFEGTLVLVGGDSVNGPGAVPLNRTLQGSTEYAKIIIGMNPI